VATLDPPETRVVRAAETEIFIAAAVEDVTEETEESEEVGPAFGRPEAETEILAVIRTEAAAAAEEETLVGKILINPRNPEDTTDEVGEVKLPTDGLEAYDPTPAWSESYSTRTRA